MGMQLKDFKGLTETEIHQKLTNIPDSVEIANIFSEALAAIDTTVACAAQKELMKRGDHNLFRSHFGKFFKSYLKD